MIERILSNVSVLIVVIFMFIKIYIFKQNRERKISSMLKELSDKGIRVINCGYVTKKDAYDAL